ncbi:MAG TPA: carboxymuconolactone decarboxylase family protein [Ilumatobacter sp.]|nr:carboxymuconolactone decarboxylase family protein [Ilumatobacter sp.]
MTHKQILDDLRQPVKDLHEHIPAVFEGYRALSSAALADGALDAKTKELIALAIAVTRQCDGCMASHARGAARRGATAAEVADALGVAILLNGASGTVHAPRAFELQEFAQ